MTNVLKEPSAVDIASIVVLAILLLGMLAILTRQHTHFKCWLFEVHFGECPCNRPAVSKQAAQLSSEAVEDEHADAHEPKAPPPRLAV